MTYEMGIIEPIIYLLFLGAALYGYTYSTGRLKFEKPIDQQRYEEFVKKNGRLLRLSSLAAAAVMTLNLILAVRDWLG